jgi:hypothetical protein
MLACKWCNISTFPICWHISHYMIRTDVFRQEALQPIHLLFFLGSPQLACTGWGIRALPCLFSRALCIMNHLLCWRRHCQIGRLYLPDVVSLPSVFHGCDSVSIPNFVSVLHPTEYKWYICVLLQTPKVSFPVNWFIYINMSYAHPCWGLPTCLDMLNSSLEPNWNFHSIKTYIKLLHVLKVIMLEYSRFTKCSLKIKE